MNACNGAPWTEPQTGDLACDACGREMHRQARVNGETR